MSVVVVATVVPLPEHRDEVIALYTAAIPQVHAEAGCELYALHQADDQLVMIERWASAEALEAHARGPVLAALGPSIRGKVTGPADVVVLKAVPAGDPVKGTLGA